MIALINGQMSLNGSWVAVVILLLRGGVGILLFLAGASKASTFREFIRTVSRYKLVPIALVPATARIVIGTELLLGTLLLVGIRLPITLFFSALLLLIFAIAVAINLVRGKSFDCGCSSFESRTISWAHVIRNSSLALTTGAAAFLTSPPAGETMSIVPSLGLMFVGFAIPTLVMSERKAADLAPYPIRSTIRNFAQLHTPRLHPEMRQANRTELIER